MGFDQNRYNREYYRKNKEKLVKQHAARRRRLGINKRPPYDPDRNKFRHDRWKKKVLEYKRQQVCEDCFMEFGEYPECCDFHHIDPDTKTKAVSACGSYEDFLAEVKKCIPLCANCHRIRTFRENEDGKRNMYNVDGK